jgi:hypothetical protein
MSVSPEYSKAFEEWSATPTPIYDEFKVDWKKLFASTDTPEATRIDAMFNGQVDKLKKTYPTFDFSKVKWPTGDSMVQLPSAVGQKLASFQNAERWALSGFESPAHLMGADEESKRKAKEQEAVAQRKLDMRMKQLQGLFGGKTRRSKKTRKTRKSRK